MTAIGPSITTADQIRSYAPKDGRTDVQKEPVSNTKSAESVSTAQAAKESREVEKNIETETKNDVIKTQDSAVSRANETTQRGSSVDVLV